VAIVLIYAISAVTLMAAAGVVMSRNIVYAALFLLVALGGVAGVFVLLYAEFLALVQILIYGGAIIIVILFAIMLTRNTEFEIATEHRQWPLAALVSGGLFVLMAVAFIGDADLFNSGTRTAITLEELSETLFTRWAIPFEVASLVLFIALVGAIVIARSGGRDEQ
jgi:NADH-quinone oxidoreductase subunit J